MGDDYSDDSEDIDQSVRSPVFPHAGDSNKTAKNDETSDDPSKHTTDHEEKFLKFLSSYFPILEWLPRYELSHLRNDLVAAINTFGVLYVLCISYGASMLNQRIHLTMTTSIIGLVVCAFMVPNRYISTGVTSQTLRAIISSPHWVEDELLVRRSSFFLGIILTVIGLCRFGFLSTIFSRPMATNFTNGCFISVFISLTPTILNVSSKYKDIRAIYDIVKDWRTIISLNTLYSVLSIIVLTLHHIAKLKLNRPWINRFPLSIVIITIFVIVHICRTGTAIFNDHVIEYTTPSVDHLTDKMFYSNVIRDAQLIIILSIMTFNDSCNTLIRIDDLSGEASSVSSLITATGVGNVVCSFFNVPPTSTATSRTFINFHSNAKTQMSGIILALLLILAFPLTPIILKSLPRSVSATIAFFSLVPAIDFGFFRLQLRSRQNLEFCCCIFVLFTSMLIPIDLSTPIYLILCVILTIYRAHKVLISEIPLTVQGEKWQLDARKTTVIQINASRIGTNNLRELQKSIKQLIAIESTRTALVIDLSAVHSIDISGVSLLLRVRRSLAASKIQVYFFGVRQSVYKRILLECQDDIFDVLNP